MNRSRCIPFRGRPWSLETIRRAVAKINPGALEVEARRDRFEGRFFDLLRLIGARLAKLETRA